MADAKEESEYIMADFGAELERLGKQHAWIQKCVNNQIVFAPMDLQQENLRVLDVGCADGLLLRDLQKQLPPSAQFVGADIMPSFLPKEDPSSRIRYVVHDLCEPLPPGLLNAFDLTLLRLVLLATAKVGIATSVKHLISSLAPGGWLQVQELNLHADYAPGLRDFVTVLLVLYAKIGLDPHFDDDLERQFRDQGLENVGSKVLELPVGIKTGSEEDARASLASLEHTIPTVIAAVTHMGGELSDEVRGNLQPEVFNRMMMEDGAAMSIRIVYGQKPAAE